MGDFKTACRVTDLVEGQGRTVAVGDKLIALFADQGGFYAIDDVCPHMGASLSDGCLEDGIVTCPWHAWRFRLADGAWADNPRIKIGCYPTRVVNDEIQIRIDNPPERGASAP